MPTLTNPTPDLLDKIRPHLLLNLHRRGLVTPVELRLLAASHIDRILAKVFETTGKIRVRVSDHETIEITPGGTIH